MYNQWVDSENVLDVVQRLAYRYSDMTFEATLFTGATWRFLAEAVTTGLGLTQSEVTRMQWLQALNTITQRVLANPEHYISNRKAFHD